MTDRPPDAVLWDFVRGATMTRALAIAADLELAKRLCDGPQPVAELAREARVDAGALHRLLRALASDGVFAEDEPGVFRNTEISERLQGEGWDDFAHLFGGVFYRAMLDLDRAVETGSATFTDAFGTDFWSWLAARPEERAAFDRAMAGGKERTAAKLAELEWRQDEVVVDIGGGNGALLVELLQMRPELRGVVFDLPETERDEAAFGERISFAAGSFFERVPRGETYILSAILHDWNDDHASKILSVVHSAAPSGARLLILESVVPAGNGPYGAKWLDLLMLALLSGRERSERDWRDLLKTCNWHVDCVEDGLIEARCR
jgi:hypothetical protein